MIRMRAAGVPLLTLMTLLFALLTLTPARSAWAGKDLTPASDEALVTITVTTSEGAPLAGVELTLKALEGAKTDLVVKTDKDGKYVVILPQGARYNVSCLHEGSNYDFGVKEIPKVEGPLNYGLKLKIKKGPTTMTVSSTVGGQAEFYRGAAVSGQSDTRVTITVTDHEGTPEPDAILTLKSTEDNKTFSARTDSNGQYILALPRGKTYNVTCAKYGVVFELGAQSIPPVDVFMLNLMIKVTRSYLESNMATAPAASASVTVSGGAEGGGAPQAAAAVVASESDEASARKVKCVVTMIVTDKQGNPESEATLKVKHVGGQGEVYTGRTDSSGKYVFVLDQAETYTVTVEKYDQAVDAGTHTIPTAESHKITMAVEIKAVFAEVYALKNVYFDTDKATLRPESFKALDELVAVMSSHPTMVIELAGHTDSQGQDAYNLKLSRSRANTVRDYVIDRGIAAQRISAKGYGETQPVATNETDEGRQSNRRTEVRIVTK